MDETSVQFEFDIFFASPPPPHQLFQLFFKNYFLHYFEQFHRSLYSSRTFDVNLQIVKTHREQNGGKTCAVRV